MGGDQHWRCGVLSRWALWGLSTLAQPLPREELGVCSVNPGSVVLGCEQVPQFSAPCSGLLS